MVKLTQTKIKKFSKSHFLIIGILVLSCVVVGLLIYLFGFFIPNQNKMFLDVEKKNQAEIQTIKAQNQATLDKVASDIAKIQQQQNVPDLPSIIKRWHPIIGFIYCNFKYTNGVSYLQQGGSGTLIIYPDGKRAILTNKHVVTDRNGYSPSVCLVKFHDDNNVSTATNVSVFTSGADAAYLFINNPDAYLENMTAQGRTYCKDIPAIGDEIIILGYPLIGSPTDLTATDGIISGYDGDYYITSAKVEHGNSGGAAIDLKNNCYLGIPTYSVTGSAESLARILKWQAW